MPATLDRRIMTLNILTLRHFKVSAPTIYKVKSLHEIQDPKVSYYLTKQNSMDRNSAQNQDPQAQKVRIQS